MNGSPTAAPLERQPWTCQACGTAYNGVTINVPGLGERRILPPPEGECAKCEEDEFQARAEAQRRRENERVATLFNRWSNVGDPGRYTLENFDGNREGAKDAFDAAKRFIESWGQSDEWLLLAGPPGSGKSHLAMAIRNEIEQRYGAMAIAVTQPYLFAQIKASWNRRPRDMDIDDRPEDWIVGQLQRAPLLVWDDLMPWHRWDQDPEESWAYERMFMILDGRYRQQGKRIVFTTNCDPGQIERFLGDRLWSRLAGRTEMVAVTAADYRREKR